MLIYKTVYILRTLFYNSSNICFHSLHHQNSSSTVHLIPSTFSVFCNSSGILSSVVRIQRFVLIFLVYPLALIFISDTWVESVKHNLDELDELESFKIGRKFLYKKNFFVLFCFGAALCNAQGFLLAVEIDCWSVFSKHGSGESGISENRPHTFISYYNLMIITSVYSGYPISINNIMKCKFTMFKIFITIFKMFKNIFFARKLFIRFLTAPPSERSEVGNRQR